MFIHGKSIIYLLTYQLRNLSISIRFMNENDQIIYVEKVDFDFLAPNSIQRFSGDNKIECISYVVKKDIYAFKHFHY